MSSIKDHIPSCWGGTFRNSERTKSRNEAHLSFVFHNLEGASNTPFLYQYCGHQNGKDNCVTPSKARSEHDERYSCQEVTAVIYPAAGGSYNADHEKRLAVIAARIGVPLVSVYYSGYDLEHVKTVDLAITNNGKTEYRADQKWREGFLDALLAEQLVHENRHNCNFDVPDGCGDWLDGKNDSKIDDEAELRGSGDDLTVSKILRQIPGVRHLDMDGCVTCDKCGEPLALIEASSDGYSRGSQERRDKKKNVFMSLALAEKLGVPTYLIQHDVGTDADCSSGCDITTWKPGQKQWDGKQIKEKGRETDLDDAIWYLEELIKKHSCG